MAHLGVTHKTATFEATSSHLSAGACLALLPNRALELPAFADAVVAVEESSAPGLRGLFSALGVAQSPAALRAGQAAPTGCYYVAVELCYWQVEMGGARWMAHGERLNLAASERAEITAALASLFATLDAQLIEHGKGELSLLCEAATPPVQAAFPDEALGCDLKNMLPTPNVWQRYLNEAQMLLADLAVNRARAARGELVLNSVWFWGAEPVASAFAPLALSYHGDDAILQALSSPESAESIQIYDYRGLFGAELAAALAQLPGAAKLRLNDGRVFQQRVRGGILSRWWQAMRAKMRGIWS